jgi:Bacterial SH3 domain
VRTELLRLRRILITLMCLLVASVMLLSAAPVHSEDGQRRTPTLTPSATSTAPSALFGPVTGELTLPLDVVETGLKVKDFKMSVRFYNPYTVDEGNWLLAFVFRTTGTTASSGYALGVSANSDWAFSLLRPGGQQTLLDAGNLPNMKRGRAEFNDFELIVEGERGAFLVNGEEVATLFIIDGPNTGEELVLIAFGNQADAKARYENLIVTAPDAANPDVSAQRTPSASIPCTVTTRRATALRSFPDNSGERITSLSRGETVAGLALSRDLLWFKVSFGGQIGWVSSFAAVPGNGCTDLPIEDP